MAHPAPRGGDAVAVRDRVVVPGAECGGPDALALEAREQRLVVTRQLAQAGVDVVPAVVDGGVLGAARGECRAQRLAARGQRAVLLPVSALSARATMRVAPPTAAWSGLCRAM